MSKTVTLKPCPFCGSSKVGIYEIGHPWAYVECEKCGAGTQGMETERKAINAWNRRSEGGKR